MKESELDKNLTETSYVSFINLFPLSQEYNPQIQEVVTYVSNNNFLSALQMQ